MFSLFERIVAFRYLRAKRAEGFISLITWFSLLGIMLGVATLIIVMSVMNGFRAELLSRVLGLNGHVNIYAVDGPIVDYEALAQKAMQVAGVKNAAPLIEGQALVTNQNFASGVMVRGLDAYAFAARDIIRNNIKAGDLANFEGERIIIGSRMAERMNLQPGDFITLLSPRGAPTAFGLMPRSKAYEVAAIFSVGMFEFDNNFVFMPLPAAQAFFNLPQAVTTVELLVTDPNMVAQYRLPIMDAVGNGWRVLDWQQTNSSFFTALQVERNVMFIILSLIIMVAAFNIISSLIMLVKDKTRDIAILRTMGASRGAMLRIFFMSGAAIGLSGTVAGLVLGVAIAGNIEEIRQLIQAMVGKDLFNAEIYFLSQLPAKIDWLEVAQVVGMSLSLSFLATLYPAWRAAKMDPVEALRHE